MAASHDHDHDHRHDHGHGHDDGHDHAHDHDHAPAPGHDHGRGDAHEKHQARRLGLVLAVIGAFFFVELFGAKAAKSDVLEADAYHLLMDVLALAVSLMAMRLASRRPSERFTYGLRRAEPLAALVNAVFVFGVVIEIIHDALEHLAAPQTPKTGIMLAVSSAALCVNGLSAWILHGAMHHGHSHGHGHAHGHHLNMRGAWLHLLGDALGSVSAFAAGLAMRLGAPSIIDPLASLVIVVILVGGAVRLLRDASMVLLDAAPKRLDVSHVRKAILDAPGVGGVHALHVWSLGTGHDAITAHVRAKAPSADLGRNVAEDLRKRFAVEYVTVQVDPE